jgi:hypothetical protein
MFNTGTPVTIVCAAEPVLTDTVVVREDLTDVQGRLTAVEEIMRDLLAFSSFSIDLTASLCAEQVDYAVTQLTYYLMYKDKALQSLTFAELDNRLLKREQDISRLLEAAEVSTFVTETNIEPEAFRRVLFTAISTRSVIQYPTSDIASLKTLATAAARSFRQAQSFTSTNCKCTDCSWNAVEAAVS